MSKADGDTIKDSTTSPTDTTSLDDPKSKNTPTTKPEVTKAPPEGAIAWLVLLSAFSISMLVDGVCFSFGIFFDDFREEFKTTKAATSWIGSVLNGSYLIIGPIVSALVNVYGCRRVAMTGSLLATVAFFLCTFSPNIGVLILTYGFMGGLGFGLMYLPSIVIVGYYFEKRRALATGIACCGSGIGAFLFAPLSEFLLYGYAWQGALWILSALVLHGVIFGYFYKPLPQVSQRPSTDHAPQSPVTSDTPTTCTLGQETTANVEATHEDSTMLVADLSLTEYSEKEGKMDSPMSGSKDKGLDTTASVCRARSVTLTGPDLQDYQLDKTGKAGILRLTQSQDLAMLTRRRKSSHPPRAVEAPPPLARKDIFYSGSLMHLKEFIEVNGSLDDFRKKMLTTTQDGGLTDDMTDTQTTTKSFSASIVQLFDFSLLKSPTFVIYGMSCFLCMAGFFVPFIYMPTHAVDMGYGSTRGALLISIIGITNTVGRVGVGFVSDQPWADCLLINNVALAIGGLVTIFVPFYTNYFLLAIYSAVFGLAIAVFVSLRSIIMVELMGLDKLTTAFGLVIMCQGLSSFVGAPIAGALSDATDSYDASFYMAGITLTLSGLICLPLRRVARWEKDWLRRRQKTSGHKHANGNGTCHEEDTELSHTDFTLTAE